MSQVTNFTIEDGAGAAVRADLNAVLPAIASSNAGTAAPTSPIAFQVWADTTADRYKLRNEANTAWITLPFSIAASNTTPDTITHLDDIIARRLVRTGTAGAEWTFDPQPDASGAKLLIGPDATPDESDCIVMHRGSGDVSIGNANSTGRTFEVFGDMELAKAGGKMIYTDGTEGTGAGVIDSYVVPLWPAATITATSWYQMPSFLTSWTPKKTGNLLVITASIAAANSGGYPGFWVIRAGGSIIMEPWSEGSRTRAHAVVDGRIDEPSLQTVTVVYTAVSTAAITIDVAGKVQAAGGVLHLNHGAKDYDTAQYSRHVSTLSIMEVAQ
jgi:hypothetical protein